VALAGPLSNCALQPLHSRVTVLAQSRSTAPLGARLSASVRQTRAIRNSTAPIEEAGPKSIEASLRVRGCFVVATLWSWAMRASYQELCTARAESRSCRRGSSLRSQQGP
jgi:hypothetical protein